MKKREVIFIFVFLMLILNRGIFAFAQTEPSLEYKTEKAQVIDLGPREKIEDLLDSYQEEVKLKILSGAKKGEEIIVVNNLSDNQAYNFNLKKGDKVAITIEKNLESQEEEIYISDYYRLDSIFYLLAAFLFLILIIGRFNGLRAIISLGLTMIFIVYLLLPAILKGRSPILLSIGISFLITLVTILIITGLTRKSLSAIVGTSLGVVIAGLISVIVGKKAFLTGLSAEDATMLLYIPQGIKFNLQELLFSGIILGALGAVMDVAMSIASSVEEIYQANTNLSKKELFASGMNVGKDIMGTMVNTLILAYTGSSIPILLLFMAYENSLGELANLDIMATEIVRSVAGSIGLILTIPITALVSSILAKKPRKEGKDESE